MFRHFPYSSVDNEFYEALTMHGITYHDVQRTKLFGTNFRLYFAPGKGIVFFYDGTSGETWALLE